MNKYIITITHDKDAPNERGYTDKETIYEQKVEADDGIVSAIVQRVLDYMSVQTTPLVVKTGGKADEGANNSNSLTEREQQ